MLDRSLDIVPEQKSAVTFTQKGSHLGVVVFWAVLGCAVLGWAGPGRRNHLWHGCSNGLFLDWANQSGRPALGPLPRKPSRGAVSPYPARWLKGASIITVQHSPCHLPLLLLFLLLPVPYLRQRGSSFPSSRALPLLQPRRLPSGGREPRGKVAFCCWPRSTQISCDRFLLHCLPA